MMRSTLIAVLVSTAVPMAALGQSADDLKKTKRRPATS